MARPRAPGKRVPVLSEKMRLCLSELSKKSLSMPQTEKSGTVKNLSKSEDGSPEGHTKRQYRKRPHIIHLCKFCMKVCPTFEQLKEHQKTHDVIECRYCGKVLARIGAWENHLKVFHDVEIEVPEGADVSSLHKEDVNCKVCGKHYTSKAALAYHVKLHDGVSYPCDKCGKVFRHPNNLKSHQLRHETKKFFCKKCGKNFHTNFALLMHENQTHRMAKSWICKYCNKAFTRCAAFREHIRIHTGEKPFECDICSVKFRKIHHLKKHRKQHGQWEGPFKCKECPNAVFMHKLSYDRHLRFKHTDVELSALNGSGNTLLNSEIALRKEFIIAEGDNQTNSEYILGLESVEKVKSIEMIDVDDSNFDVGGQGGQCVIVLSDATGDPKTESVSKQKDIFGDISESSVVLRTRLKSDEDLVEQPDDSEEEVQEFSTEQLASLQEHMQLNEQMTEAQLQQLSMVTLEGGKFQVQMDGETFDVYTVGPHE